MQVNVLLNNCKQTIMSLSLLVGTTVQLHVFVIIKTEYRELVIFGTIQHIFASSIVINYKLSIMQCSPFITLCLGSIGINCVIRVSFCKGIILPWNFTKEFHGHFSIISLLNSMVKNLGATTWPDHFQICVIMRCYKGTVLYLLVTINELIFQV